MSRLIATYQTNYKPIVIKQGEKWDDDVLLVGFQDSEEYGDFYPGELQPILNDIDALTVALQYCDFVEWYDPFNGYDGSDVLPSIVNDVKTGISATCWNGCMIPLTISRKTMTTQK